MIEDSMDWDRHYVYIHSCRTLPSIVREPAKCPPFLPLMILSHSILFFFPFILHLNFFSLQNVIKCKMFRLTVKNKKENKV